MPLPPVKSDEVVSSERLVLIAIAGPSSLRLPLNADHTSCILGRDPGADGITLDHPHISRRHARLMWTGERWSVSDLGSTWGTLLNGRRLTPHAPIPIEPGDRIHCAPYTLLICREAEAVGVNLIDDAPETRDCTLHAIGSASSNTLRGELLEILLAAPSEFERQETESALAQSLLRAAIDATRMPNGAVLRIISTEGEVEVLAGVGRQRFSRSLVQAAMSRGPVEFRRNRDISTASIIQLGITSAMCMPISVGSHDSRSHDTALLLYLDSDEDTAPPRDDLRTFCLALARIASGALAAVLRRQLEARMRRIEYDIQNAQLVQETILRDQTLQLGGLQFSVRSQPGQRVGGDFHHVIPLDEHRLIICIGDVAGKGIPAGVVMAATHGHLHASLRLCNSLNEAIADTNRYLASRLTHDRFVTAWIGLIDLQQQSLHYIDCGHGYAWMIQKDGTIHPLRSAGGPALGVDPEWLYESATCDLRDARHLVAVTDGLVEEFSPTLHEQFGADRLAALLVQLRDHPENIAALFEAVGQACNGSTFQDDATALWTLLDQNRA